MRIAEDGVYTLIDWFLILPYCIPNPNICLIIHACLISSPKTAASCLRPIFLLIMIHLI